MAADFLKLVDFPEQKSLAKLSGWLEAYVEHNPKGFVFVKKKKNVIGLLKFSPANCAGQLTTDS